MSKFKLFVPEEHTSLPVIGKPSSIPIVDTPASRHEKAYQQGIALSMLILEEVVRLRESPWRPYLGHDPAWSFIAGVLDTFAPLTEGTLDELKCLPLKLISHDDRRHAIHEGVYFQAEDMLNKLRRGWTPIRYRYKRYAR